MSDSLYLLDGYSLVYRSYFAFIRRPLFNPKGKNSSAIYGFFRSLFLLLEQRKPTHFAVVLDSRVPTFRHEMYAAYKETRQKTPEDLKNEIPVIEEILSKLGVPTLRADGYEADDVIATLARQARESGTTCYVVSGDKDLLQLVDGSVRVLKPESGGGFAEMDRDAVVDAWGVTPEQILDYLSLVGDTSDNVPGVKGIGEKSAAALLQTWPDIDAIYANLDDVSSKSQREKLVSSRESALLSRDLVRLKSDVDLSLSIDDLRLRELDSAAAAPYFAAEGMGSLLKELTGSDRLDLPADDPAAARAERFAAREMDSWLTDPGATLDPSGATDSQAHEAVQRGAADGSGTSDEFRRPALYGYTPDPEDAKKGDYELVDTLDALDRWCARAKEAGVVAFDSETTSLNALRAQPVGFSLAVERGAACYIPLHGPDGPVLPAGKVKDRLKELLEDPKLRVVGQNLKYDFKVMSRWGVRIANPWFDTMIAAWLLDTESNKLGMDDLARDYLGYETVHYDQVVPKAKRGEEEATFDTVALDRATEYAAEDADVTLRLYRVLHPLLKQEEVDSLFFDLEMKMLPILADMELEGIGLDVFELEKFSGELEREVARVEAEIYTLVGHEFNIASTKQLQQVLFEERKLSPGKKTKTGYSTDTSVLSDLVGDDPVPELVLRYRMLTKLKSTYVDSLPGMVDPDTGRVHTHFNVTGTATGRLSSTDPNLQNIPIRDDEGRRIRTAFVPRDGWVFVSADYAQLELVILAHLSDDPGLKKAFAEGVDVHRHTGALIFGVDAGEVTAQQRRIAKTINFGVMYGMSAFRLARELQISRTEAAGFIEAYFATYSRIKAFIDETVARAEACGYVETILGRRRYLANIASRNQTVKSASERVAVNTPIQGSGADIMKRAMIELSSRLADHNLKCRMLLQVHDELILECPVDEADEVASMLREAMTGVVSLSVPLGVSVERGASWGEMH
ncbi:MAG: DNA polymerase I [Spirochaetaceae bacterium]|nr:MAG: DNA polymerase I [Spirochaetaceae bacterium]